MSSTTEATRIDIEPVFFCSQDFDYLIIGGGTAGLVVATRLSENPDIKVGVLEAGPAAFDEPLINIPGRFGESLGTKYDWNFETAPQAGIGGRKLPWARGKVLGGSSALNFMTWNRGCREDYDAWEALGNEGWGWDGLLPYFKKSEKFVEPPIKNQEKYGLYFNSENHGTSGPIRTTYSEEFGGSHPYWHAALNRLGVETNKNHFGGSNVGVWTSLTSVDPRERKRSYSATGYYQPVASRYNLVILTEAFVEELRIGQVGGEWIAQGARFCHSGAEHYAEATKEVIVCAGSVQSPQLLEISGIGNADILANAGINVKFSNPNVGENLQDHMMTTAIYEIRPDIATADDLRSSPDIMASALQSYLNTTSGPLTEIPSSVCYLPFSSVMQTPILEHIALPIPSPSIENRYSLLRQKILASRFEPGTRLGQIEFNFDRSNYSPYFTAVPGKKYATMMQMLQYPFSVGSIHIPEASRFDEVPITMHDKPIINPRYYQDEGGNVDFLTMVESQTFAHKITKTPPLSSIIIKRVFPSLPEEGKEEDFADFVRNYTVTDWHPVGTCAMGPEPGKKGSEFGGVVDARLRVYGVKGLRVVDASIMPTHISAHIQATVYAIAEKGASMILEDYH